MSDSTDLQSRLARLDRLRRLGLQRGTGHLAPGQRRRQADILPPVDRASVPAEVTGGYGGLEGNGEVAPRLPGAETDTPFGPAWTRVVRYPLTEYPHLADWLHTSSQALAALDRNTALLGLVPSQAAFIDTETTGLSLGTGVYTFLVGIGVFESPQSGAAGAFVVYQFFMRHPGEERAQLHLVEQVLDRCTGLVSFNGRSFDLPLLTNRFVLAGMPPPAPAAPHLDLLAPARRLWRAHLGSCRLTSLERGVLKFDRPLDDVPGYLIPGIYQQFYRTGTVTDLLVRVFDHNLHDILSMPLLAARMARLFQEDRFSAEQLEGLHPLEQLSLGRCYEALGWHEASIAAYRAALSGPLSFSERSQALRELSFLYKRVGRRDLAAALWEEWVSTDDAHELTPYVELAKYHEWHTGDLRAAHGWAAWALHIAEADLTGQSRDVVLAELRHRLARLERKLAGADDVPSGPEE